MSRLGKRMPWGTGRVEITAPLVAELIATQFPQWTDLPVVPVACDGWDNATYRLGKGMSVRLPRTEKYALQVDKEHRWLPILAHGLPLPIPRPLVRGAPGCGYPLPWSVYRWLEGDEASAQGITDIAQFAADLADFLVALRRIDPTGGPRPGRHNSFRGGQLVTYDGETRAALAMGDGIDVAAATAVWTAALAAAWDADALWLHGEIAPTNLLVADGRLSAVIDFGSLAVGDPACDLTIAWTFLSGNSREVFRRRVGLDGGTWARARGWALWKALVTLAQPRPSNPDAADVPALRLGWRQSPAAVIDDVIGDNQHAG